MMRRRTLHLIFGLLLCVTCPVLAEEISFRGADLQQLATVIATESRRTNQLPPAYLMPMANGRTMTITNANAFELLARAVIAWRENGTFPQTVLLLIDDLNGPAFDAQTEPTNDNTMVRVPSADIGAYTRAWLAYAESQGHKLMKSMTFATRYRLTAAQYVTAMAILIDETTRQRTFAPYIVVPAIRSPQNWIATQHPLPILTAEKAAIAEAPILVDPDVRIRLNGTEVNDRAPVVVGRGTQAPYCGTIRIEIAGFGPVDKIRLLLDKTELKTFDGIGPHLYTLNSIYYPDGIYTLSVTAFDPKGKPFVTIFSFSIMNGRKSGFTPAEREEREITPIAMGK